MKKRDKKLQAAIMAALQYIQEEESGQKKQINLWARNGRERMMANNRFVQKRGRILRPGRV
ncbi:MAG: hypothetical protein R6U84_08335 [Candidatus Cloacimonadales bacterium]